MTELTNGSGIEFLPVFSVGDIADGTYAKCTVAGYSVLVCHVDNQFYAIENRCPHAGMPLEGGALKAARIVCPVHGAEFDVKTGKVLSPPAFRPVRSFHVRVVEGSVQVSARPISIAEPPRTRPLGM